MTAATEHLTFAALADPTRLRIVLLLLTGELCVCDLTAALELPQSTVSRHMARLRIAGLVHDRRNGKWVFYSLSAVSPLQSLQTYLAGLARRHPYAADRHRLARYQESKPC